MRAERVFLGQTCNYFFMFTRFHHFQPSFDKQLAFYILIYILIHSHLAKVFFLYMVFIRNANLKHISVFILFVILNDI